MKSRRIVTDIGFYKNIFDVGGSGGNQSYILSYPSRKSTPPLWCFQRLDAIDIFVRQNDGADHPEDQDIFFPRFYHIVHPKLKGSKSSFVIANDFLVEPDFRKVVDRTKLESDNFAFPFFWNIKSIC